MEEDQVQLNLSIDRAVEAMDRGLLENPSSFIDPAPDAPVHFTAKREFLTDPLEIDLLVIVGCDTTSSESFTQRLKSLSYSRIMRVSWDEAFRQELTEIPEEEFKEPEKPINMGPISDEDYVYQGCSRDQDLK
jgi:hypothetical protein